MNYNLGDKIVLNYKKDERPMIPNREWDRYINCIIVFIGMNGTYRVRDGFNHESLINEEDIKKEQ